VLINGMPCANTGTEVKGFGHVPTPPGVSPDPGDIPANEGTLVTGSKTVLFGGASQSRLTSLVSSCSWPVNLPTSVCVAIPMGAPVLIGGPEAMDFAAAATQGIRTKWVSKKLHGVTAAKKGSKRSKLICFLTGHPVDVVTGELLAEVIDFELPGMIPMVWERNYRSRETDALSLGPGWYHSFDMGIEATDRGLVVRLADGRPSENAPLAVGASLWDGDERYTLTRTEQGYELTTWDGLTYTFAFRSAEGARGPEGERYALTGIHDRCMNHVTLEYEKRILRRIVDSCGRKLDVRWTPHGRLEGVYFERLALVRYAYDDEGRLAAARDAHDEAMTYAYRGGVLAKETHKGGLSFYFEWDWDHPMGSCIRTWGDGGIYDRRLTYDEHRHFTLVDDGRGGRTHYWGNALGLVDKVMDPTGRITQYEWDAHGRKLAEVDGAGNRIEWAYDAHGNVVCERDPLGNETIRTYNDDNLVVSVRDPGGHRWEIVYDGRGMMQWLRSPLGCATRYTHDERGRLVGIEDPMGRCVRAAWNDRHEIMSLTDGENRTTIFVYDALGRRIAARDAGGRICRAVRDDLGRITQLTQANGEHLWMRYDAEGNLLEQLDAQGRRVVMRYGGFNRLVEQVDPMGHRVQLVHDLEEDLVAVVNAVGEAHRFDLDLAGRVAAEVGFDGRSRHYHYDKAGRCAQAMNAEYKVTRVERDGAGRIVKQTLPDGTEETFAFDPRGQLVAARFEAGSVLFERDAAGRIVKEHVGDHVVESRYDLSGLRVERRTDLGHHTAYDFDDAGDLRGVRAGNDPVPRERAPGQLDLPATSPPEWAMQIARDPLGLEIVRRMPGGVVAMWDRDTYGRPSLRRVLTGAGKSSHRGGTDVLRIGYRWRGADQIDALIDTRKGPTRFGYDPRGHLIAALFPDGSVQHRAADAVGNLFRTADCSDRTYGSGGVLERANGTAYRYDNDGQLVEKRLADGAVWSYTWNGAGRLSAVQRPDGKTVAFAYDAFGRRIRKECDGRITEYVWDGDDLVHECVHNTEGEAEPLVTWIVEPGTFAPVAKVEGYSRYGVVTDHLGTPAMLLSEAGRVAWKAQLDLYGVPTTEIHETACPWRYPGQYEDPETGLYYNRFRYYDPEAGRYISQDPIGLLGGLASYAYVHDPIGWLDPWGLTKLLPGEGLVGAFQDLLDSGSPGDNTTPHHIPSNGYMRGRSIPGYTRERGMAINMEHPHPGSGGRHRRTLSNGRLPDLSLAPRDVLAQEVWDVRKIYRQDGLYDGYIRARLQQIIVENKRQHPRPFAKGCK
jgi:RHS repeat-associated protein